MSRADRAESAHSSSVHRPHGRLAGTGAAESPCRPRAARRDAARLGRGQARHARGRRRGACAAWCEERLAGAARTLAAPRLQSHRHGAAHQSRPRAAGRRGDRGGGDRHALAHDPRIRPGRRRPRRARRPCRALALPADRRGGRDRGEQQCRRRAAGAGSAGGGQGGDRLARRADRDRRRLPHPRHHGARRLPAGRGRHHQPHASQGLCRGDRAGHGGDHEGPSVELRRAGLHQVGVRGRAGAAGAREGPAGDRGSRQRHPGRSRDLGPAARAHGARGDRGRHRCRHLLRRQAAGRPAGRAAGRQQGADRAHRHAIR